MAENYVIWFENLRIDPAHGVLGLRINVWVSIGVFLAALVWWVTEPFPTYVRSRAGAWNRNAMEIGGGLIGASELALLRPGAHVIIMSGEGYTLMWPEGEEPRRYEWREGSMIVPPNLWFHQHFNTGTTPARYLAFKAEGVAIRNAQGVPKAWISRRLGGDQIDYADEDPAIRKEFEGELAKVGLSTKMDTAYQQELESLPPKAA